MEALNTIFGKVYYSHRVVNYTSLREPVDAEVTIRAPIEISGLLEEMPRLLEATNRVKVLSYSIRSNKTSRTLKARVRTRNNYWDLPAAVYAAVNTAFFHLLIEPSANYRMLLKTRIEDVDVYVCGFVDTWPDLHADIKLIAVTRRDLSDRMIKVTDNVYVMYRTYSDLEVGARMILDEFKRKLEGKEDPNPNLEKLLAIVCNN